MKHVVWVLALLVSGCILPVSTGAPMPATTVGKGHLGFALSGEAPTLDLISDNEDSNQTGSASAISYGAAPAAAATMTFSYGIADNTDLEIAGEGALFFFFLPIPTGGSIGIRQHIDAGDTFDVAVSAKIGSVSSSATISTSGGDEESSARATYGAFQATLQTKHGPVRPLVAINLMPATVNRDPSDADPFKFKGLASSATFAVPLVFAHVTAGPYISVTNFYSDRFNNSGWFASGGLYFAVRPDRNRKVEMPAPPPAYYPAPMPTTDPQPMPAGPPTAPPPPPSAPTPTAAPM